MNIEEILAKLWLTVATSKFETKDYPNCIVSKADLKALLTAYEKEKGENVKLRLQDIPLIEGELKAYKDRVNELKQELEKEKEKNKELESDIQQKNFEIKCLNSDIKNMYCEEGVITILEDNFDLSREEAIQILEEE